MSEEKKYSENPTLCKELVYEDAEVKLTKIWTWDVIFVLDKKRNEASFCTALLSGSYITDESKSTFVSYEGKRLIDLEFDYLGDYEDEMLLVGIKGKGYGFLNKNLEIAVPIKYRVADNFCNGYASVHDGKQWLYVDKKGNELRLDNNYAVIEAFSDGMARVSTMKRGSDDLAYHSDYDDNAGKWGYVDLSGKEVIKPQYIYAFDFTNDRAIVVKGEWIKDKKWNNKFKQNGYWSEEKLWGVIDKNGNEVILCRYDEIREFANADFSVCEDYYQVHVGGWKDGKWAIMDRNGRSITEPIFDGIEGIVYNGLVAFYEESDSQTVFGVYDLNENKFLFKPQFNDVSFLDDGNILVEVFDKDLGYNIEKIIDKKGNTLASGETNDINNAYCIEEANVNREIYCYRDKEKVGIKNLQGKVIIPAIYDNIDTRNDYFYLICTDEKQKFSWGICNKDGTVVLKPEYFKVQICDDNIIICNGKNGTEGYKYELKQNKNR